MRQNVIFNKPGLVKIPVFGHILPVPKMAFISESGPTAVRSDRVVKTGYFTENSVENGVFLTFSRKTVSRDATN